MTIHLAEGSTGVAMRRSLARWNLEVQGGRVPIRYGFSIVCVAVALAVALGSQYYSVRDVELPVFELGIVVATWYAGTGPSVLAVELSAACYNYFFSEPLYSFEVSNEDLTSSLIFTVSAASVAWFVAVRRRIESDLRHARDHLQVEVEERKRREDEIRRLNYDLAKRAKDLETSNNELESFAYSVSHDLRAPLRHVVGYSELLQKQASSSLDDRSRRYLQTIDNAAKRMGNLIDDLLGFSRIGRAETRKTLVNLEQLAREVVKELEQETSSRDIAWKI